jgi:branched-chain amino acid transport system permease protein
MSAVEGAFRFAVTSLSVASIYILVAIGLSITLGTLKFVNFAHGALYLLGVYVGLIVGLGVPLRGDLGRQLGPETFGLGWGFFAALVLTPIVVFAIGLLMERYVARPFYDRPDVDQILVTFGLLLVAQELVRAFVGGQSIDFRRPDWASGALDLGALGTVSAWRMYVIVITAALVAAVYLFIEYTDIGLAVRAGTEDTEMVELLGIRVTRPFLIVFGIGSGLAGAAGVVGGPIFNVVPEIGVNVLIPAFLVVVIGGVGSIVGSVLGGLAIGAVFTALVFTNPVWAEVGIYALAAAILLVRPAGLLGKVEVDE